MSSPSVTIVVPNYNHVRYLPERLESIRAQTYRDYEVLLLDDASTDGSRDLLEAFAAETGARVEFNRENSGSPFRQWNKGVGLARGRHVWIAESDDVAEPGFLATLVGILDADPGCVLAYCRSVMVDPGGSLLEEGRSWPPEPRWAADFVADGLEEARRELVIRNTIPNASAVVFRRDAYLAAGGADESLRYSGDWVAWSRILPLGRIAHVGSPLNRFRKHPASVSGTVRDTPLPHLEAVRVLAGMLQRLDVPEDVRRQAVQTCLGRWMEYCWRRPARLVGADSRAFFREFRRCDPCPVRTWLKSAVHFGRR